MATTVLCHGRRGPSSWKREASGSCAVVLFIRCGVIFVLGAVVCSLRWTPIMVMALIAFDMA